MGKPDPDAVALDAATQLDEEGGAFFRRLGDEWEIWGPSGGYLAALTLRAAGLRARIPRPVSYYCHFLSPPAFDRVEIEVEELKRGRRSESLAVRMTQGGRDIMFALVRTARTAPATRTRRSRPRGRATGGLDDHRAEGGGRQRLFPFWNNVSCRRPARRSGGDGAGDPGVGSVRADADLR